MTARTKSPTLTSSRLLWLLLSIRLEQGAVREAVVQEGRAGRVEDQGVARAVPGRVEGRREDGQSCGVQTRTNAIVRHRSMMIVLPAHLPPGKNLLMVSVGF